ncbi:MAG: CDC27 family protein [Polaribacter sp.]|nr:CDC27 family protein [Polaribacter sp.]
MDTKTLLEKYFDGSLSKDEKIDFERLLAEDSSFRDEFEFEKNVKTAITINERNDLKKMLQSFETTKKPKKSFYLIYAAASIVFFIGLFTWMNFSATNYDTLFNEYYQTYPNTVSPTVRGTTSTDLKSNAFYAYDSGNYEEAIALFSEIYSKNGDDFALFYKGISLIELQKYDEALAVLQKNNSLKNSTFEPYFLWYTALIHIKLQNKNEATLNLKLLIESENPLKKAAKKLLSEIE